MPILMAVIGEANTRKSSTIRALTGAGKSRQSNWNVTYTNGMHSTYVQLHGLQEAGRTEHQFITDVQKAGANYVITALRARGRMHGTTFFNDAATYLVAFQNAGWTILPIAELVCIGRQPESTLATYNSRLPPIHAANTLAANQIAHQLRASWGIL